jgi:hypothetical protein
MIIKPPGELALLFPELPTWALAPFLGDPYQPVDFSKSGGAPAAIVEAPLLITGEDVHRAGEPPQSEWRVTIVVDVVAPTSTGRFLHAHWWFRSIPWVCPFGTAHAKTPLLPYNPYSSSVRRTRAHADVSPPEGALWSAATPRRPQPSFPQHAFAQRDLCHRWAAIPDPAAQQAILNFWLGHPVPQLAELGLALVGRAVTQRV